MVQFARHAVVEFNLEWAVKCYHCVGCDHETTTEDKIIEHLKEHKIKQLSSVFVTSGASLEGDHISHSTSFNYSNDHETAIEQDDESEEPVKEETVSLADAITEGLSQEDAADIVANDHDMAVELNLTAPKTLGNKELTSENGKSSTESANNANKKQPVENRELLQRLSKLNSSRVKILKIVPSTKVMNIASASVYHCQQCPKFFQSSADLKNHVSTVHNSPKHVCNVCGENFKTLKDMDQHMLVAHAKDDVPLGRGVRYKNVTLGTVNQVVKIDQSPVPAKKQRLEDQGITIKAEPIDDDCDDEALLRIESSHSLAGRSSSDSDKDVTPFVIQPMYEAFSYDGDERRFACGTCGKTFRLRHHLSDHVKAIHKNISYGCEVCGRRYKNKRHLKMHLLDHRDEGIDVPNLAHYHRCRICNKAFLKQNHFENHIRSAHGSITYPCKYCSEIFMNEDFLKAHELIHGPKQHKCDICSKVLPTAEALENHVIDHITNADTSKASDSGKKKDKTVEKGSDQLSDFYEVVPNETKVEKVKAQCSRCELSFEGEDAYNEHYSEKHADEPLYRCSTCKKTCEGFGELQDHILTDHKDDVSRKNNYYSEGDFGVDASSLEVTFSVDKDNLTPVIKKEKDTDTSRYACVICKEKFQMWGELDQHNREAHGLINEGYTCDKCGKKYLHFEAYKSHICGRLMCKVCNRVFEYKGHLLNHLQKVHNLTVTDDMINKVLFK